MIWLWIEHHIYENMKSILFLLIVLLNSVAAKGIDTTQNYLFSTPDFSNPQSDSILADLIERVQSNQFDITKDFYLVFRLREPQHISFWNLISRFYAKNPLVTSNFLSALSQVPYPVIINEYEWCMESQFAFQRQMCAMLYRHKGSTRDSTKLKGWLQREKDPMVQESIRLALARAGQHSAPISYLPVLNRNNTALKLFYNKNINSLKEYSYFQEDSTNKSPGATKKYSAPIITFGTNFKNAPSKSRYANKYGPTYHIGVDCGWLLEGLPVHSISDGIVKKIQHESSWGVLIAIESVDSTYGPLTFFYGHLGYQIEVTPGDLVKAGQIIGRIGNNVSISNGGYWSHVHVGIEKSTYQNARIMGYDTDLDHYVSVYDLLK